MGDFPLPFVVMRNWGVPMSKNLVSTCVASILLSASLSARADAEARQNLELPAGGLVTALKALAAQSDVELVYQPEQLRALRTDGVKGSYSPQEAIAILTRGTGLKIHTAENGAIMIAPTAEPTASLPGEGGLLRVAQVESGTGGTAPDPLDEVIVQGLVFKYDEVETANKMGLSVKDTPQSVKVVTADMLDFAKVTKFEHTYKLDAGSHTSNSYGQTVRAFLRGFQLDPPKVDGLRTHNFANLDLALFERFEIIKGATSTVYGQSPVGGTVNAVSKKPLPTAGGEVSLEGGSYEHVRADADFYGPLGDKWSYRLVGAYLDEDAFTSYSFHERQVFSPSLKYDFSDSTSLLFQAQYQNLEFAGGSNLLPQFMGGDPADPRSYAIDLPRSFNAIFPGAGSQREFQMARALLEHRFENDWMLRANAQMQGFDVLNKGQFSVGGITEVGDIMMYMYARDEDSESYSGEVTLFGDVEALGRAHTLFLGFDYNRLKRHEVSTWGNPPDQPTTVNAFDPDYSVFRPFPDSIDEYPGVWQSRGDNKEFGLTGQAVLRPSDRLSVMLGARYSDYEANYVGDGTLNPLPHDIGAGIASGLYGFQYSNTALTYQAGVTYGVTDDINLYASYGETFQPRDALLADGSKTGPEEGESMEIGAKGELLDRGRLGWSMAVFDTARTNIAQGVPGTIFVVLLGDQRSRGIEFDLQGEIGKGWDVYLSAAVLKNRFEGGENDGKESYLSPRAGLSLFTSYEFQDGGLRGLGVGGGVVYKKRGRFQDFYEFPSRGNFDHLFEDPLEVDLRVFYKRNNWNFELAGTNILNDKYYSAVENSLYSLYANPPRSVLGKVTYSF
jgi:iron complex outermembrane receptor protein